MPLIASSNNSLLVTSSTYSCLMLLKTLVNDSKSSKKASNLCFSASVWA
jgi:hypothetical protein